MPPLQFVLWALPFSIPSAKGKQLLRYASLSWNLEQFMLKGGIAAMFPHIVCILACAPFEDSVLVCISILVASVLHLKCNKFHLSMNLMQPVTVWPRHHHQSVCERMVVRCGLDHELSCKAFPICCCQEPKLWLRVVLAATQRSTQCL